MASAEELRVLGAATSEFAVSVSPGAQSILDRVVGGDECKPEPMRWLYRPLLAEGTVCLWHGHAGHGKSMVALFVALMVSLLKPVLYIAAEKGRGVRTQRVPAWKTRFKRTAQLFFLYPHAVNLLDNDRVAALIEAIEVLKVTHGDFALIVLDTLTANAPGADQNDAAAMSQLTDAAERIREAGGRDCTVLILHHSARAHNSPRGSTQLEGGPDSWATVRAKKNNAGRVETITVATGKQSDGPTGKATWRLEAMVLHDAEGTDVSAAVAVRDDAASALAAADFTVNRRRVLDAVASLVVGGSGAARHTEIVAELEGSVSKSSVSDALTWAVKEDILERGKGDGYSLGPAAHAASDFLGPVWAEAVGTAVRAEGRSVVGPYRGGRPPDQDPAPPTAHRPDTTVGASGADPTSVDTRSEEVDRPSTDQADQTPVQANLVGEPAPTNGVVSTDPGAPDGVHGFDDIDREEFRNKLGPPSSGDHAEDEGAGDRAMPAPLEAVNTS